MTAPATPATRTAVLRVAFAGTPAFAAAALDAIHCAGFPVPLVLTQPDRPGGRGLKPQPSAVKQRALALGLPLAQPRSLRLDGRWPEDAAAARDALVAAAPDVLVVAAYGLILPAWVLALPRLGGLNIHASLLPRWRGAAPIQRAIEAGDARTGITLMQMDEGLDTGAILLCEALPIAADDSAATLHDRLAVLGARLVVQGLLEAAAGRLRARPQPEAGVSYAHKIAKAEAPLDWRQPAVRLERRVRAFDPFPGASFVHQGEAIKVWRAAVVSDGVPDGVPAATAGPAAPPGTVLDAGAGRLVVACGDGALELLQLQRPGGRRVAAAVLLQGHAIAPGTRLPLPAGADA
jgi:methionyl-tRNA formyltransferase